MKLVDAIREFEFDCKIRKLSPGSIENYDRSFRYLVRYLADEFHIHSLEQVEPRHIKQFLAMKDDAHCKPQYINDLLKAYAPKLTDPDRDL